MASPLSNPPPLLSDTCHIGISQRYHQQAIESRTRLYSNCTLPTHVPRTQYVMQETFNAAIEDFRNRKTNTHDAFHILDQEKLVSSATVYPGNTEEDVSTIVKWANQYLPNRILWAATWATVEQLPAFVAAWLLNLECPTSSFRGGAEVRGYTPYGGHWASHCGMEVVLPTSEIMRWVHTRKDGSDNPHGRHSIMRNTALQSSEACINSIRYGPSVDDAQDGSPIIPIHLPKDDDFEQIIEIIPELRELD
ncbi:hypothetical protein BDD12DRAFT_898430 [Trichophaea hybrida]|nr:hypothetical protein BDD12DRAFT_898430 [Trichophaea hybrida]